MELRGRGRRRPLRPVPVPFPFPRALVAPSLPGTAAHSGPLRMTAAAAAGGPGWFEPRLSPPAAWCPSALYGHNGAGGAIVPPNKPSRAEAGRGHTHTHTHGTWGDESVAHRNCLDTPHTHPPQPRRTWEIYVAPWLRGLLSGDGLGETKRPTAGWRAALGGHGLLGERGGTMSLLCFAC